MKVCGLLKVNEDVFSVALGAAEASLLLNTVLDVVEADSGPFTVVWGMSHILHGHRDRHLCCPVTSNIKSTSASRNNTDVNYNTLRC